MFRILFVLAPAYAANQCLYQNKGNLIGNQNPLTFNNVAYDAANPIAMGVGRYTIIGIDAAHPFKFVAAAGLSVVSGDVYSGDYYVGNVTYEVTGDFDTTSWNCQNHGAMGGNNHVVFDASCTYATDECPTLNDYDHCQISDGSLGYCYQNVCISYDDDVNTDGLTTASVATISPPAITLAYTNEGEFECGSTALASTNPCPEQTGFESTQLDIFFPRAGVAPTPQDDCLLGSLSLGNKKYQCCDPLNGFHPCPAGCDPEDIVNGFCACEAICSAHYDPNTGTGCTAVVYEHTTFANDHEHVRCIFRKNNDCGIIDHADNPAKTAFCLSTEERTLAPTTVSPTNSPTVAPTAAESQAGLTLGLAVGIPVALLLGFLAYRIYTRDSRRAAREAAQAGIEMTVQGSGQRSFGIESNFGTGAVQNSY